MKGITAERCDKHPDRTPYVLSSGRVWCPHQSHDGKPSPRKKGEQPKIVGKSSPWLDEQQQEEATA